MMLARPISLAGKVLLVDDIRLNRLVLRRMLEKLGFEVLEAENGLAAIEQFISHRPALCCVLLDLQMPVMDGWETAQRMRGLEARCCWSRVPIVACTALGLQENWHNHNTVADSVLSCGVDDLLEKMPTMAQLLGVMCKYVSGLSSVTSPTASPCSRGLAEAPDSPTIFSTTGTGVAIGSSSSSSSSLATAADWCHVTGPAIVAASGQQL